MKQAVLLVGGRGSRLGELTTTVPKPMLPVGGRPFLDHLVETIARFGVDEILLLCGYLGHEIAARFDGTTCHGASVRCIVEPFPAGTGGALRVAESHLRDPFLLANGDTLFDINLLTLAAWAADGRWLAKMALRRVTDATRYGTAELDGAQIRGFRPRGTQRGGLVNAGIYVVRRRVLDFVDRMPCSLENQVFPALATKGLLIGQEMDGFFIDIGIPADYAAAQDLVPARLDRPLAVLCDGSFARLGDLAAIADLVKRLNDRGFRILIAQLQEPPVALEAMKQDLRAQGAVVDAVCHGASVSLAVVKQGLPRGSDARDASFVIADTAGDRAFARLSGLRCESPQTIGG